MTALTSQAAYSGAAPLITSPDYLEVAANILTVEARHSAFINLAAGRSPFPAPFVKGITPTSITTLAAPFFASCPSGSAPPFVPFPKLAVTNAANATQGSQLSIQANTTLAAQGATLYCNFVYGGGQAASPFTNNACTVPSNVTNGQTVRERRAKHSDARSSSTSRTAKARSPTTRLSQARPSSSSARRIKRCF